MKEEKGNRGLNLFVNYLFLGTVILAAAFSYYKYYHLKDFDYYTEAACDPSAETCFYRPCDVDADECLPNELSFYKAHYVKAYDFPKCADNSCAAECDSGAIQCAAIECDSDAGDVCSDDILQE